MRKVILAFVLALPPPSPALTVAEADRIAAESTSAGKKTLSVYETVKARLDECMKDVKQVSDMDLPGRILESVKRAADCGMHIPPIAGVAQIAEALGAGVTPEKFAENMARQVHVNAATSLADINYRVAGPEESITRKAASVSAAVCQRCSQEEREMVQKAALAHLQTLQTQGVRASTPAELAARFNEQLGEMKAIAQQKTNGDFEKDEKEIQLKRKYYGLVSHGEGLMFLVKPLSDKLRQPGAPSGEVTAGDIVAAKTAYTMQMAAVGTDLSAGGKTDLASLVKDYPVVAGQLLAANASQTAVVCDALKQIEADAAHAKKMHHAFNVFTAVAGGILLATGIGALGTGVIAGITGSTEAAVVAGAATTAATVGGAALGSAAIANSLVEAEQASREMNGLVGALQTGSSDAQTVDQLAKERRQLSSSLNEAFLNAGLTAGGGLLVAKGVQSIPKLRALAAGLADTEVAQSLARATKSLGESQVAQFLRVIGNASKDVQQKVMAYIHAKAGQTADVDGAIQRVLKQAGETCA